MTDVDVDALATVDWEPTTTDECEWCASRVQQSDLARLDVSDELCPEDVLLVCPDCEPDDDVDPRGPCVIA